MEGYRSTEERFIIKLPLTLEIGAHTYVIKKGSSDKLNDRTEWGNCNNRTKTIEVDVKQVNSELLRTLIEEILHAVDFAYGHDKMSEEQIYSISEGLAQVVKQLMSVEIK
jgi:hypothetical protein